MGKNIGYIPSESSLTNVSGLLLMIASILIRSVFNSVVLPMTFSQKAHDQLNQNFHVVHWLLKYWKKSAGWQIVCIFRDANLKVLALSERMVTSKA